MKKTIYFILFVALSGLNGCMLGPNFQRPQYSGPDKFRFATGDTLAVNLKWWELMDDPVLDTLIVTAINENKDVMIAAARIEEARANIGYTDADRWPELHFGAGAEVKSSWGNRSSGFSAYPEFSWEIGFWGKYRRMNETALASYLATEYAQRTIQLSLVSAVATTYFNILASYDLLNIAQNTLASRDSGLVIMKDKYEGGMISQMDFNQAKIQRDIAAAVVPVYKRSIALNENALSILLGKNPQKINTGDPFYKHKYVLDIPAGLPSELLERRPDVKQAEEIYHAQLAQVGIAEALRWPSLSLTGLFGAVSNDLLSLNAVGLTWSAGAGIFSPLFQFGKNKRRVEMAKANAKAALIDYEKATQQAFKDVEDALVNISTFKEELNAQESRAETAIISENLSYVRYDEGATTYLEVLEQQRQSFSSQLDVLTTRLNLLNSYILLYKALGGGWLTPEEEKAFMNK
jgi:multidrug efflux system outer membrane protein